MKIYEYKGKIYSEEDISEKCSRYEGDLYDLCNKLERDGEILSYTAYYCPGLERGFFDMDEAIEGHAEYGTCEEVTLESIQDIEPDEEVKE